MSYLRQWLMIFSGCAGSYFAMAQSVASIPGAFIREHSLMDSEGGYNAVDSLYVSILTSEKLHFYFVAYFDFGHTCGMEGDAYKVGNHYEHKEQLEGGVTCILKLIFEESRVRLEDMGSVCRTDYCGVRGSIHGATFYRVQKKEK